VFRELMSDPFLMAPLPPPAPLLVSPAAHMARMMRMMDNMVVQASNRFHSMLIVSQIPFNADS
jgi:hypothetical protein